MITTDTNNNIQLLKPNWTNILENNEYSIDMIKYKERNINE